MLEILAVAITLKSILASGVLYTTTASSDTALFTSEDKSSETGYAKVADVTVDGTKATLAFADGYQTQVNITLGADGTGTCMTLSTSALPTTDSTVALDASGLTHTLLVSAGTVLMQLSLLKRI